MIIITTLSKNYTATHGKHILIKITISILDYKPTLRRTFKSI